MHIDSRASSRTFPFAGYEIRAKYEKRRSKRRITFNIELVTNTRKYRLRSQIRNIDLVVKRENRPARTTDRQNFGNGRMTPNVAALRSTAAASLNGRRCCYGLRCVFGCAFRCFFPPLRASRAAGGLFGTGRTSFLLESFRLESSMASVADCWRLNQHSEKQKINKTRWLDRSK